MGSEVIIMQIVFFVIFGIFYLFISSRHKERLALIEKGADASIFYSNNKSNTSRITPLWKIFIINIALLFMAIGLGIFLAAFLHNTLGVEDDVAYPGTIFLLAGCGLFVGFSMTKKLG